MLFSQLVCVEDDTFLLIGEQLAIERGGDTFEPAIINFPPFSFLIHTGCITKLRVRKGTQSQKLLYLELHLESQKRRATSERGGVDKALVSAADAICE